MPDTSARTPISVPDFLSSLRVLWRRRYLVLLGLVVVVAATAAFDASRTKEYQSSATLSFMAQGVSSTSGASTALSPQQLATDVEILQGAPLRVAVSKSLGRPAPPLSVNELGNTELGTLTVTSTNPAFAAAAANAYANAYIVQVRAQFVKNQLASENAVQNQINALQSQITAVQTQIDATAPSSVSLGGLQAQLNGLYQQQSGLKTQLTQLQLTTAQSSNGGELVSPAVPSTTPSSPKKARDLGIAVIAGLLVGIGFGLLRESFDDRLDTRTKLEALTEGLPILGLIPTVKNWRDKRRPYLVSHLEPKSPTSEAYRGLRTSVQFMLADGHTKLLQITSSSAGEGKTTTSANLAWIMAEAGQQVVLVSCDLRRPRIAEFFDLPSDIGLLSVVLGDATLEDALLPVPGQPNLRLLASGPIPPNPSEILSYPATQQVLTKLGGMADLVVVDGPPVLPVTDAAALSRCVDAVILLVSTHQTRKRDVERSLQTLRQVNAPIVGTVLNLAGELDSYAYYHYGYGYESGWSKKSSDPMRAKRGSRFE